jgi:archaellum component FlaC
VDLFGRLEYFFQRLEKYIEVRPTEAMKNIIVKIMAEVLSILGIVTKEIGQGRTSMSFPLDVPSDIDRDAEAYLKKLIGRKDVEEALQRLDQLTQEECRMAAAEALVITRSIDDKVMAVDDKVMDVGDKVRDVVDKIKDMGDMVRDVDYKVKDVDEKVEDLDEKVQGVNIKVETIDDKVRTVDSKVQGVDHKVGSVIQGDIPALVGTRICPQRFNLIGVKETGAAIEQVMNQVTDLNRSSPSNLTTDDCERLTPLTGNELRKDLRKWIAPPDPSVNYNAASDAHQGGTSAWCTEGNTFAAWKSSGSLLWIHGKRTYPSIM